MELQQNSKSPVGTYLVPIETLLRLKELSQLATAAPWFNPSEVVVISTDRGDAKDGHGLVCECEDPNRPNKGSTVRCTNADLIAESRNVIDALIDEVLAYRARQAVVALATGLRAR